MDLSVVNTTLNTVAKFINEVRNVKNYYNNKSLADISKLTRVEPLTIVSKDLISFEPMSDVQQAVLSMFSAHYLQAMNIIAGIQNVEVVKALDKLNPARDETGFLLSESLTRESVGISLEAYKYSLPRDGVALVQEAGDKGVDLNDVVNLSVGRMIKVTIAYPQNDETGAKAGACEIPVNIRLMASSIPNGSIVRILAHQTEDTGVVERYHAWRSGRISFIKDLIFAQDLIDENKRALISDDSRTLEAIMSRVSNNKKYGLLTRNPSLASASNIFVISEEVARELESKLGGKLSNASIRNKAFENTYTMLLVVVDREWNRVTFYTRGCQEATDLSLKDIKNKSGSKGPDLMDMMKAMNMGMNASF